MANLRNIKVSGRYATALYDLAVETAQVERIKNDIMFVNDLVSASRELILVFRNPMINVSKKIAILNELFWDKVSELTLKFLILITKKGRIICLDSIADTFLKIYNIQHGIKTVYIETATELDVTTKNKLHGLMTEYTKNEVILVPEQKAYLIGGFRLRFDDYLYDASIRHKLELLKKEFEENIYERKL